MIPRTFPSTYASNGQQQMVVHFLPSVVGLERWSDYIPVKLVQGGPENSYSGTIDVAVIPSLTAQTQAWKEYIPVYVDDAGTDAWTVNAVGYIPYNYALFTDASMQLDLTNGGELDPRVTFTRTSNATVTDSTGTLVYAPHNLLTFSESFDNAAWTKTRSTVSANVTTAPDGTSTADKLVEDTTASNTHRLDVSFAWLSGFTYTNTLYAKAAERTAFRLQFPAAAFTSVFADFDLSAGTVTPASGVTASITDVGNGWYRCAVTGTATASTTASILNALLVSGSASYTGDGTSGIFIWGAQLNVGSLQPYNPTTRKNLLGFTQEFDNAGWTKSGSTVTANAAVDPQGFMTADKVVVTTPGLTLSQGVSGSFPAGSPFVGSFYVRAEGSEIGKVVRVGLRRFDATALQQAYTEITLTGQWQRISQAITWTVARTSVAAEIRTDFTTGTPASEFFVWGAQLSDSASLDPYVYNPGAAPASTAYFGPRFDYDPVTLAPKGLLIEESRTNLTPYSRYADTQWTFSAASVGTATKTAIDGATVTAFLTDTTTAAHRVNRVVSSSYTANAIHTFSFYVAKPATSDIRGIVARVRTSAGGQAVTIVVSDGGENSTYSFSASAPFGANPPAAITASDFSAINVGNGWTRITIATAVSNTNTTFTQWDIGFSTQINGETGAGTANSQLFIDSVQLESGSFSTSYIPTTTAAATRAADVAVMQGANFSNWYSQSEGTLFSESIVGQIGVGSVTVAVSDGTANNRLQIQRTAGNNYQNLVVVGGATQSNVSVSGVAASVLAKSADAFKLNNFNTAVNGVLGTADTSGTVPTVTQLDLGSRASSLFLNGHIRRLAFFPRRLADAELTSITS